jgi:hypothetical protein
MPYAPDGGTRIWISEWMNEWLHFILLAEQVNLRKWAINLRDSFFRVIIGIKTCRFQYFPQGRGEGADWIRVDRSRPFSIGKRRFFLIWFKAVSVRVDLLLPEMFVVYDSVALLHNAETGPHLTWLTPSWEATVRSTEKRIISRL